MKVIAAYADHEPLRFMKKRLNDIHEELDKREKAAREAYEKSIEPLLEARHRLWSDVKDYTVEIGRYESRAKAEDVKFSLKDDGLYVKDSDLDDLSDGIKGFIEMIIRK